MVPIEYRISTFSPPRWYRGGCLRRTGTSVCHAQQEGTVVLLLEVLIGELLAVNALAASAIALGEVSALDHKLLDHTVESTALVVEGFAALAQALLAGAERAEVLSGLGDNVIV